MHSLSDCVGLTSSGVNVRASDRESERDGVKENYSKCFVLKRLIETFRLWRELKEILSLHNLRRIIA